MEKLKLLFEKAKIRYIISVDDCHLENQDADIFSVKENMLAHLEQAMSFFRDIAKEEIAETLSSLDSEDIESYLESVLGTLPQESINEYDKRYLSTDTISEKNGLIRFFEELKLHDCIFEYILLSGREEATSFFSSIQEKLLLSSEVRALWMIDNDLHLCNGSSEDGQVLIGKFIESDCPHNIYALTSAQVGDLSNERFRSELLSNPASADPLLACVINKHNIIDMQYEELCNQMAIGFRQNYSGVIKTEFRNIFSTATTGANEKLRYFGEDTLYRVFFESGKAEGISAIDVFQRLLLLIIKEDITKNISSKYEDISRLVARYTSLCEQFGIEDVDKKDYASIRSIRISECYDSYINAKYSPVSYGDIFSIDNTDYILVEQACDLAIRERGARKAQCATLAKIKEFENSEKGKSGYPLAYYAESENWQIDYNDCINIDFDVLDLCSLNSSGLAELSSDFSIEKVYYRYPRAVYTKLKSVIESNLNIVRTYKKIYAEYKTGSIEFCDFCNSIREIYKDNSLVLKATITDGIKYNVRRIKRLSVELMDKVIREYSEYHSRKGLDYDFAEKYHTSKYNVRYIFPWEQLRISATDLEDCLPFEHTFYLNSDGKKNAAYLSKTFLDEYKTLVLTDAIDIPNHNVSLKKTNTIEVPCSLIPIIIGSQKHCNVIQKQGDTFSFRIPIDLIPGLKQKKNSTYNNELEGKKGSLKIGNNFTTFAFSDGEIRSFYNSDILEKPISLSFCVNNGIVLNITMCELESESLEECAVLVN